MAKTTFFGSVLSGRETNEFDFSSDYPFQEQLLDSSGERVGKVGGHWTAFRRGRGWVV